MAHPASDHLETAYLCRLEEAGLLRRDDLGPVLRHLGEVCPACAAVLTRWRKSAAKRWAAPDYGPSFARIRELASAASATVQERRQDERRVRTLLALSTAEQRECVETDPSLASSRVVQGLLTKAREALALGDPRVADVAELVELLAHRLPRAACPQAVQLDFLAEAELLAAQARLARGELAAAVPRLGLAEALAEHGAGSPFLQIELQATAGLLAFAFDDRPSSLRAWADVHRLAREIEDPDLARQAHEAEAWVRGLAQSPTITATAATGRLSPWAAVLQALGQQANRLAREAIH